MKWAELGEAQGGIADSDNVWWLHLVHYGRDIAKSNTQLSQLNVAELFLETLRTLKKFCLFYSTHHFIMCEVNSPLYFCYIHFNNILSTSRSYIRVVLYFTTKNIFFSLFPCLLHAHFILLDLLFILSGKN
jgi:hypothetical protein